VQLKRSLQKTQEQIRVQLTSILNVENVTGKRKQSSSLSKSVSSALPPVYSNLGTLHDYLFSYTFQTPSLRPWCLLFGPIMLATTLRRLLGIMASPIFALRMKMMASSRWMFAVNMMSRRMMDSRHGLLKHVGGRALGGQTQQLKIF
jgi:hypothetical protein